MRKEFNSTQGKMKFDDEEITIFFWLIGNNVHYTKELQLEKSTFWVVWVSQTAPSHKC